ncbi:MAG: type IV toxin-antitoxin system AbiEi family antitoxin domain-containing protein [Candidatus Obscuribacterales bacterium]|nr:type IV toxin-antitoxin system AbiEi family antitoxin domain-containing protein [Candidatus Obscuribacterales bacterium]
MARQQRIKLNQLQHVLPEGLPVDSNWLQKRGYSRQLIAKYLQHGWLASPVRSVYWRDSTTFDQKSWEPVVISLQNLLEVPVTVGGRTALELQGLSHYLSRTAPSKIQLYGSAPLPTWINKLPLKEQFVFQSTHLFRTNEHGTDNGKTYQETDFIAHRWGTSQWSMIISTPERAILELIDELPTHESFHQVDVLMEGLSNLRPKYLATLLARCRSIKTKRLFLWFAARHNHAWLRTLDAQAVNIGRGKRMIVPGGKLDSKYLITVPEEFANDRQPTL